MNKTSIAFVSGMALLIVYLFVSAPPPLPVASAASEKTISVRALLEMCAEEQASIRTLYTKEIVGPGKAAGLEFDEHWDERQIEAGPLPALFLREIARNLERSPVRLALFLGSDKPINQANLFKGEQAAQFARMQKDRQPKFFFVEDIRLHTAMFPDLAVVAPCVDCHNAHRESPKSDWQLNAVMGATTWTYPEGAVDVTEALTVLRALRQSFRAAYTTYLNKAKTFSSKPGIGRAWPTSGYFLPSLDTFMQEANKRTSPKTMERLLEQ